MSIFETKTFECILFKFYRQLFDLTPSYKAFYFWGPGEVCGCGCGKIFKNHTRAVLECAEGKAIVRRVCGCAKSGCTQIL